jgi:hypothetical protein
VLDPGSHRRLKEEISARIAEDRELLDELRAEIRPLRDRVQRIRPRSTTAISLVGTDGGNNTVEFDPFLVQVVRVVDSSNNEYCLEAITPTTPIETLSAAQFGADDEPQTPIGHLMADLGVRDLTKLSHMIRATARGQPTSGSWVQVYRELAEWAVLYTVIKTRQFGTDTLIVFDGLLRSKVFGGDGFRRYLTNLESLVAKHLSDDRRRIFLVGLAKHSKVLARYRLAMALEGVLTTDYPAYVEVPREIEERAYVWSEYARGDDRELDGGEVNKFVGGKMFLVKFGSGRRDPIWPVDIFSPQTAEAPTIMGYLMADATNGFPVPLYPRCLQKAHENAALVGFDFDIIQDGIYAAVRRELAGDANVLDAFRLQDSDPASARYE